MAKNKATNKNKTAANVNAATSTTSNVVNETNAPVETPKEPVETETPKTPVETPSTETPETGTETPATDEKPVEETVAPVEGKKKPELTPITEVPVGSVVAYASSAKPYIVSEANEKGRVLFSATQKFFSSKNDFAVKVLRVGTGELPEAFEINEKQPDLKWHQAPKVGLNDLLLLAKADLVERKMIADKKAQAAAKTNVEEVAATVEGGEDFTPIAE